MMAWLRQKALDPILEFGYCVLNHSKEGSEGIHRRPKGRPSKKKNTMALQQVNETMTYNDIPGGQFETIIHDKNNAAAASVSTGTNHTRGQDKDQQSNCLLDSSNDLSHHDDSATTQAENLNDDDLEGDTNALTSLANLTRDVLDEKHVKELKVMLGSAWIDADGWLLFHRFPEVVYVDTTFSSCNEARPLLLVCGRDSNGKGFIVNRVYMPNETKAFFMWIFLRALPRLLGLRRLGAVQLLLTDGDSQEYESVDAGRDRYFTNAFRGRCCRHAVYKTYENEVGDDRKMDDERDGSKWGALVRQWVYDLCNGKGAMTKEEYDLSSDMLFDLVRNNKDLKKAVGVFHHRKMLAWLEKMGTYEKFIAFYRRVKLRAFNEYMTNIVENPVVGDQFVSVHLPIGKQKESKQFRRKRRRV